MSICFSWPLVIGSPETDVNTRCKQHPRELRWETTNQSFWLLLIILKNGEDQCGFIYLFACLSNYLIQHLGYPNVIMMQMIHLSVFYLNDQLNCMASPFPDLYYEGLGLVLLSPNNILKTLSQLFICQQPEHCMKKRFYLYLFPCFSSVAALESDLLSRPFMSEDV